MATVTANLRLLKPDLADNISPAPMNENMEKIDEAYADLSVDYVVAQGVQGKWRYRRWNSGLAECWYAAEGNTGAWRWWSTKADWLQYGSNVLYAEYPLTFAELPMEFASATCSTTDCWLDRTGGQTVSRSSNYYVTTQGDTAKTAGTYRLQLYVVGRWK